MQSFRDTVENKQDETKLYISYKLHNTYRDAMGQILCEDRIGLTTND